MAFLSEMMLGMALNQSVPFSRASGSAMATLRSGPRKKLNGVSVPVHLVEMAELIQEVESAAYEAMGGDTKKSLSDVLSDALALYVAEWIAENGAIPTEKSKRSEYVQKLAERNLRKLRDQLNEQ